MHELSIALSIIDIAEQEVNRNSAKEVVEIELEIGKLSGIEPYALDFAWDMAIMNTVLEKAKRITRYIEATAVCQDCGHEFEIENIYDGIKKWEGASCKIINCNINLICAQLVDADNLMNRLK